MLLPDGASKYLSKIFDDKWMRENGFLDEPDPLGTVVELLRAKKQRPLITARKGQAVRDVIALMRDNGVSQMPVLAADGERLVGIVAEVDLLDHLVQGRGRARHADRRPGRIRLRDGDAGDAHPPAAQHPQRREDGGRRGARHDRRRDHQDRSHRVPGRAQGAMKRKQRSREAGGAGGGGAFASRPPRSTPASTRSRSPAR